MRYFLVAGEASGDLHASALIRALRERDPEASFAFMGGDKMQEASGVAPLVHYREVAFMGVVSVLKNLRKLTRIGREVQQAIRAFQPDVVIPVDYADFNFRFILPFAKRKLGIPIVYYILPKVWAWRSSRVKTLRRYVDLSLSILPFEVGYFEERGLRTTYIGNPCVDAQLSYLEAHPEPVEREQMILLVPGSRRSELQHNLSEMLQATAPYASTGWQVVIAGAPGLTAEDYRPYLQDHPDTPILFGDTYGLMRRAHAALVTSGTATLEAGLWALPMIVCYRMGGRRIARWVFERFFQVDYFSLVNLILGKEAVPELLADRMHSAQILSTLTRILPEGAPAREAMLHDLRELQSLMGREKSAPRAAEAILHFLRG
nr:lipid-A-disaccharide synthase [uncultured Porphyromonas sp.]